MNTIRERFIERLLRQIFLRKGSGFVLKGGAAMRSLYGEQRYTKDIDLDFTNPKRSAESLHGTISSGIEKAARGLGVRDLRVSQPKKAEKTPRWKINFSDSDGRPFHVEIEVSRDADRAPPGQVVLQAFVPQADRGIARFWVDIYDHDALAASKLAALLGRDLPRDVYDLDVLRAAGARPNRAQIDWALGRAEVSADDARALLAGQLKSLSWERFESELRGALAPEISGRIDEQEWTDMKARVLAFGLCLLENATVNKDG